MTRRRILTYLVFGFITIWLLFTGMPELVYYQLRLNVGVIVPDGQLPPVAHPIVVDGIWQIPSRSGNSATSIFTDNSTAWSKSTTMSIPKILHQTFPSEMVYSNYLPLINSCLTLNPDWDYYLWRDSDAEAFIASKYPNFLAKYRSYKDNLERADSIRYIVLHHFGGIYLDMDVECKQPFFPALSRLPAFLDQERTEQSNIMWSMQFSAMNSAMGSTPGHPFFQAMINAMNIFRQIGNAFDSTGPRLLTQKYKQYSDLVKMDASMPPIALLEAKVMSPLMDTEKNWKQMCRYTQKRKLYDAGQDPLDPEQQGGGGGGPGFQNFHQFFQGSGFQFRFHFN